MINANLSGAANQATRRGEIEGLQWPDYYDGELLAAIRVNCFVNFLRLWTRFDDPLPLDLPLYLMEGETLWQFKHKHNTRRSQNRPHW